VDKSRFQEFRFVKYTRIRRTMTDTEIIALYETGVDSLTVAIRAGCCDTAVRALVRAAGGTIRDRGKKSRRVLRIPDDEIARLYRSGVSGVDIANIAGCSPSTLYNTLRDIGGPVRASFEKAAAERRAKRRKG
jgi:hypothetical protein